MGCIHAKSLRFVHLLCQNGERWPGIVVVWLGFPSSNHLVREVFRYSWGASARDVVKCSPGLIMHFDAWFELFLLHSFQWILLAGVENIHAQTFVRGEGGNQIIGS